MFWKNSALKFVPGGVVSNNSTWSYSTRYHAEQRRRVMWRGRIRSHPGCMLPHTAVPCCRDQEVLAPPSCPPLLPYACHEHSSAFALLLLTPTKLTHVWHVFSTSYYMYVRTYALCCLERSIMRLYNTHSARDRSITTNM